MSLIYNSNEESDDVLQYVKTIYNNDTLCLICHHDETIEEDPPASWDRYQFKCNHMYHTRCLRKWCYHKQKVNCPICGDVDISCNTNYNCSICGEFHTENECLRAYAATARAVQRAQERRAQEQLKRDAEHEQAQQQYILNIPATVQPRKRKNKKPDLMEQLEQHLTIRTLNAKINKVIKAEANKSRTNNERDADADLLRPFIWNKTNKDLNANIIK